MKRENQQDATNSMFIIKLFVSTCFGHHYAHHQENKTVSSCMWCFAWLCKLWLAVVLWSCVVICVHTVHSSHSQTQPTHPGRTPHAVGHGLIFLMMGIKIPETCWYRKFDNKHRISCILLVLSLHLMFTMHGHKNLNLLGKFGLAYPSSCRQMFTSVHSRRSQKYETLMHCPLLYMMQQVPVAARSKA